MRFSPDTYIRWLQAGARRGHAQKIAEGKARGRPPTPQFIVDAIVAIKRENLRYSAGHIARMISGGELKFRISKKTVAQILKAHGFKPRPKGKRPPREEEPGWVAQQLRNAFMDLDDLPEAIVMDRDSIFLPIVKQTLPAMGIKTIRIGYKCPWQNAVVERFHRTLADELLRDVQPVNDRHLNRLLVEFRK